MADFSGIGAFAEGALRGYDTGLSRFATIEEMRQRREAGQRAAQAQALQSLISGTQLATQHPDVAERFVQTPGQEILPVEPTMAAVERSRALRTSAAKFAQAVQTGDFDETDPDIANFVTSDPVKYTPLLNEAINKKRLKILLSDPALTPQQRVQMMISQGIIKPDVTGMQAAYPSMVGSEAEARAAGTGRGELPFAGPKAAAVERGKSDVELEPAPGRFGISRGQAQASERELGQTRGSVMGRLLKPPPGYTPGESAERALAIEGETPYKQALAKAQIGAKEKEPPREATQRIILGILAHGYYYDNASGRTYGPNDLRDLARSTGVRAPLRVPTEVGGNLVFAPRPIPAGMDARQAIELMRAERKRWVGKSAVTGQTPEGTPIIETITDQMLQDIYSRMTPR